MNGVEAIPTSKPKERPLTVMRKVDLHCIPIRNGKSRDNSTVHNLSYSGAQAIRHSSCKFMLLSLQDESFQCIHHTVFVIASHDMVCK